MPVRLVNWADEEGARFGRSLFGSSAAAGLDARPGRARAGSPTATASRCPTRCARTASSSTARSRRARSSRARAPTSSCTSSRARCSSRSSSRSGSCSAPSASSARASPGTARPPTPARRRWTSAATRWPARRSSRSRSARSPREVGGGAVCTSGGVVCRPGHRHLGRRDGRAAARPAPPRRRHARRACSPPRKAASERFAAEERLEVAWERIWSIEPILFDETLIGFADEAVARGRRELAPAAVGAAARRRRGRARRRADGDALRAEPARPLAHASSRTRGTSTSSLRCAALDRLASKTLAWLCAPERLRRRAWPLGTSPGGRLTVRRAERPAVRATGRRSPRSRPRRRRRRPSRRGGVAVEADARRACR